MPLRRTKFKPELAFSYAFCAWLPDGSSMAGRFPA
jgi:hypothetical protein